MIVITHMHQGSMDSASAWRLVLLSHFELTLMKLGRLETVSMIMFYPGFVQI